MTTGILIAVIGGLVYIAYSLLFAVQSQIRSGVDWASQVVWQCVFYLSLAPVGWCLYA